MTLVGLFKFSVFLSICVVGAIIALLCMMGIFTKALFTNMRQEQIRVETLPIYNDTKK